MSGKLDEKAITNRCDSIDRLSESVLDKIGLNSESMRSETVGESITLTQSVAESRRECRLKYLTGSAVVVYGIPIQLRR